MYTARWQADGHTYVTGKYVTEKELIFGWDQDKVKARGGHTVIVNVSLLQCHLLILGDVPMTAAVDKHPLGTEYGTQKVSLK